MVEIKICIRHTHQCWKAKFKFNAHKILFYIVHLLTSSTVTAHKYVSAITTRRITSCQVARQINIKLNYMFSS